MAADKITDGLGCYRCGRAPCACGEGVQSWDAQRARERQASLQSPARETCGACGRLLGMSTLEARVRGNLSRVCSECHVKAGDLATQDAFGKWRPTLVTDHRVPEGVFVMACTPPTPGPRPVSAEDAMKRANEACALAEKAVATAERASERAGSGGAPGALARAIDRASAADRSVVDSRIAEAVAIATEARNRADACARLVDGLSEGVLGGMAGHRLRTFEGETSRTFADVSARLVAADERIGRLLTAVDVQMKERATADARMAELEARHRVVESSLRTIEAQAVGFEDEARGARTAASGWRRSTWVAALACMVLGGAFMTVAWRCAVLAREADEARAALHARDREPERGIILGPWSEDAPR